MDYCHFLNVHKPPGPTSFGVVARVRRLAGTRKVGHLGTLDPMAEGVLPLALGTATRLIEYVGGDKRYLAELTLGVSTDTLDAQGQIIATADPSSVSGDEVVAALAQIAARGEQVPPMASALHHEGKRLYELFRAGQTVEVAPRAVRIDAITVASMQLPKLVIDVRCGAGTYIRSIARDIGEVLGCGAHLSALVRARRGPFTLDDAVSLERLEADGVAAHLMAPRAVVDRIGWLTVLPEAISTLRHGGRIGLQQVEDPHQVLADPHRDQHSLALADARGDLIAIGRLSAGGIAPLKVFAGAEGGES